jgi:hypothetical protein
MTQEQSGGCLCGQVKFQVTGLLREVVFCHCAQCRRQSGLYFAATSVGAEALDLQGAAHLTWYAASDFAKRGFCATCGSALFWKPNGEARYAILAGAFDDPSCLVPGYHICTEGKPAFYAIADGLPQYYGSSPTLVIATD